MAKVYILCGKICSGKSTYSQQLRKDKKADAYYVDEGLAEKFKSIFEIPGKDEIDVWVEE